MYYSDFLAGFALSLGLIIAIGAQNVFVIQCGVRRTFVLPVVLFCVISDAVLIAFGVYGFARYVGDVEWVQPVMTIAGAGFLIVYGAINLFRALFSNSKSVDAPAGSTTLKGTLAICFALTWLNPHVYLDTVVLIGIVSTKYANDLAFVLGGASASLVFFFALGFGARALSPLLSNAKALRAIDIGSALILWFVAYKILVS